MELAGKTCRDLLNNNSMASETKIANGEDGSAKFVNALYSIATTPEELLSILSWAQQRRSTQSTSQNDVSSRSHAVYQIRVHKKNGGVLTLLDCAGTERGNDSMYHSKEHLLESTEINASL